MKPCSIVMLGALLILSRSASATIRFEDAKNYTATAGSVGSGPAAGASTDFNGDGHPDLAFSDPLAEGVSVLLNQGDGRFGPRMTTPVNSDSYVLAAGDFNHDGIPDLASASDLRSKLTLLYGKGDGSFALGESYTVGSAPQQILVLDLNRDGVKDMAVVNSNSVSILLAGADGGFKVSQVSAGQSNTGLGSGDVDGDGIVDLIVGDGAQQLHLLRGAGDGRFTQTGTFAAGGIVEALAAADVNGDGYTDAVTAHAAELQPAAEELTGHLAGDPASLPGSVQNGAYGSDISVFIADGKGGFLPQVSYLAGASPAGVAILDLDGDGHVDIVSAANRANQLVMLAGKGDGTFTAVAAYDVTSGPQTIVTGDFDGDGRPDVATPGTTTPTVSVLRNLSTGATTTPIGNSTGAAGGGSMGWELAVLLIAVARRFRRDVKRVGAGVALCLLAACNGGGAGTRAAGAPGDGSSANSVAPGGGIETPVASTAPDAAVVKESYVRLHDPLPADYPAHPEACDWIGFLRYRHVNGAADATRADAIITAMPGTFGGASSFDVAARNIVRKAAARGKYVEFWAIDRRGNCLEDHTGFDAAQQAHDYHIAFDYYWHGREINGRKFAGFLDAKGARLVAEMGLKRTVEDWHAVITRGIPDPEARKQKVFCGGHSLGGPITAAFASWDFDGNPDTKDDAGFNQCAGYIAWDTGINPFFGTPLKPLLDAALGSAAGAAGYSAVLAALRSGAVAPYFDLPIIDPELMALAHGLAEAADEAADSESDLKSILPRSQNIDDALKLYFSENALRYAAGPTIRDFRLTNAAMLGVLFDDNSQFVFSNQISIGTFDGGPVHSKEFPQPNEPIAALGPQLAMLGAGHLMIPAQENGPLYTWRNYDHVGDADAPAQLDNTGQPFTTPDDEVSDVRDVARLIHQGPVDLVEWYFPLRLWTDPGTLAQGFHGPEMEGYMHEAEALAARPTIGILAARGTGSLPQSNGTPARGPVLVLPGYNHIDVITAAEKQNNGEPEMSSEAVARFVLHVLAHPGEDIPASELGPGGGG